MIAEQPDEPRTQPAAPAAGRWRRRLAVTVMVLAWLYLAVVLAAWILLREADLWWPSTLLMFSPRWLLAFPAAVLLPAAFLLRRRSWIPTLIALVLVLGPVTGFCVPWQRLQSSPAAALRVRLLTCNMHYTPPTIPSLRSRSLRVRLLTCNMHYSHPDPDLLDHLIMAERPDIVALQEWSEWKHSWVLTGTDWHVHNTSGLFLASRYPLHRVVHLGSDSMTEKGSVMLYELETPGGLVTVFSLHLASPRDELYQTLHDWAKGSVELEGNTEMRWKQHEFLVREASKVSGPLLLAGDFNTPPESAIFRGLWDRYFDAFAEAGWGWGYTFYGGKTTVRIDHILAGPGWRCERCWVGPNVGSPHRPVLADLTHP